MRGTQGQYWWRLPAALAPAPVPPSSPYSRLALLITSKLASVAAFQALVDNSVDQFLSAALAAASASTATSASATSGAGVVAGIPPPEALLALELAAALAEQRSRTALSFRRDSEVSAALSALADSVVALCDHLLAPLYPFLLSADPAVAPHAIPLYAAAYEAGSAAAAALLPTPLVRVRSILTMHVGAPLCRVAVAADLNAVFPATLTARVLTCLAAWAPLLDSVATLRTAGSGFLPLALVTLMTHDPHTETAAAILTEALAAQSYPRPAGHDETVVILASGLAAVTKLAIRRTYSCYAVPDTEDWVQGAQATVSASLSSGSTNGSGSAAANRMLVPMRDQVCVGYFMVILDVIDDTFFNQ